MVDVSFLEGCLFSFDIVVIATLDLLLVGAAPYAVLIMPIVMLVQQ